MTVRTTLLQSNRSQAIRFPKSVSFPAHVRSRGLAALSQGGLDATRSRTRHKHVSWTEPRWRQIHRNHWFAGIQAGTSFNARPERI